MKTSLSANFPALAERRRGATERMARERHPRQTSNRTGVVYCSVAGIAGSVNERGRERPSERTEHSGLSNECIWCCAESPQLCALPSSRLCGLAVSRCLALGEGVTVVSFSRNRRSPTGACCPGLAPCNTAAKRDSHAVCLRACF
jgi:hypothetical protein